MVVNRREFVRTLLVTAAGTGISSPLRAQVGPPLKEVRIGYQKTGVLVIARQQAVLEKYFSAKGINVKWVEFTSGPPLLDKHRQRRLRFSVGDTPPIFAQAAARSAAALR